MTRLKATLLLMLALPFCAATLTSFPMFAFLSLTEGPPLELREWLGGGLFWVLALVVAVLTLRASVRTWRGESSAAPVAARASPVLLLLGLAFGLWWSFSLERGLVTDSEFLAREFWCQQPSLLGFSAKAACDEAAVKCLHEAWNHRGDASSATALEQSLTSRRTEASREADVSAKKSGIFDDHEVRAIDRLLEELRDDPHRPAASVVNRTAIVCLSRQGAANR